MSAHPTIDPELLELLREISADPKSRLMKLATHGVDSRIGLRERPISEGEPFLTRAERHLVREHREQVAHLLFEAAKRACLQAPQLETTVYQGPHSGWEPVLPQEAFDSERATVMGVAPADADAVSSLEEFDPALQERTRQFGAEFALASFRLVPRDSVRNLLALAMFPQGKRGDGFRALEDILGHRPSTWYRLVALHNKAFELGEDGRSEESLCLYREAFLTDPSRPEPLVGLLHTSLVLCDAARAIEAAGRLAEFEGSVLGCCLDEYSSIWDTRAVSGVFAPSKESAACARQVVDRLPSGALRIARVFLNTGPERRRE